MEKFLKCLTDQIHNIDQRNEKDSSSASRNPTENPEIEVKPTKPSIKPKNSSKFRAAIK